MIRRATLQDVDNIMDIVHSAQLALRELGIDQWQEATLPPNQSRRISLRV